MHKLSLQHLTSADPHSCKLFWDKEQEYRKWVADNQETGFIVACDKAGVMTQYPMIHRASHKLLSSEKIHNYTTGDYFKVCALDEESLVRWAQNRKLELKRCKAKGCL